MTAKPRSGWTLAIVSVALFMTALDNLVVGIALPSIRAELGGSLESLEWTVNAYTLAFAVFLLTGAALGDRFGRKRMFVAGLALFTALERRAPLSRAASTALIAARALQGLGAAIVTPLTLTLLNEAVPAERRGAALGIWAGVSGPRRRDGAARRRRRRRGHLVALDLLAQRARRPRAPAARRPHARRSRTARASGWTCPGLALAGTGLLGLTFGIVRANALGWTSATVADEHRRSASSCWPRSWPGRRARRSRCCRCGSSAPAGFAATNGVSFAMFFGTFGSIFLLSQFFQAAQGLGPFEAGLRTLPWTAMPMIVAPIAGLLSDRIGSRPLMATGLALQAIAMAWLAVVSEPDDAVRRAHRAVRPGRHRHGARLRAERQRRAGQRPPAGGRPGLGRDERDPRGRRRHGRRGAGRASSPPTAATATRRRSPTA